MNTDNKVLKDNELENVSGGTNVGGVCGFNDATIGNPTEAPATKNNGEESNAYKVGIFPGLSALP